HCTVEMDVPESTSLNADAVQLSILLRELVNNSKQALMPEGGSIRVKAVLHDQRIAIDISDSGRGFTELEREHAFDPFYSGRQAGRGLGFGLPKCWQIVQQHNGEILIESKPGGPTTVRVFFPATQSPM